MSDNEAARFFSLLPVAPLTRDQAQDLQAQAIGSGDLLVWTVFANPSDYPGKFVARPHSTRLNAPLPFRLQADTLDALREDLPLGLTWMDRNEADDPVIVETWI